MSEPFVGQIMPIAFTYAPADWLLCQGQILNVNQYQALYSLLGDLFGGDGNSTFGIPDLRGRTIVGSGVGTEIGTTTNFMHGSAGGALSVELTAADVPSHTHDALLAPQYAGAGVPRASGNVSLPISATVTNLPVSVTSASLSASDASGQANTPSATDNQLASPPPIPTIGATTQPVKIYAPAGGNNVPLANPIAIDATVSGNASGSASGALNLPITGQVMVGGAVMVEGNPGPTSTEIAVMQPYLALNTVIAVTGIYPPKP